MDKLPLDETLIKLMDNLFKILRPMEKTLSDTELRCLIVSSNLRGLAESLLEIDDHHGQMDLRKTALGLLGTADWLKGDLEPSSERHELK